MGFAKTWNYINAQCTDFLAKCIIMMTQIYYWIMDVDYCRTGDASLG
jgi:hypothetical protein